MILAIDIGNTNIVLGGVADGRPCFQSRLSTDQNRTEDEYAVYFKHIFELYRVHQADLEGAIISSVVPPLTNPLARAVKLITGKEPLVVGPGVKTGLNILIDNPGQLGADLVVAAVATMDKYPLPQIIFDMGTATTTSVIDRKGNFLGGQILPGLRISLEALTSSTAQLPRISLEAPDHVIGRNTIDSMKSGLVYGHAAMIDGLIARIEEELGDKATVIATGGLAPFLLPYCRREGILYDNELLLHGLWLIYQKNAKR